MALVQCPDCEAQISDEAPACPRCGKPMAAVEQYAPQPPERPAGKFLDPMANLRSCLGCVGLLFVLAIGGFVLLMVMGQR